ncbi:MAG: hypothetical protein MI725_10770 [Pirellulales bacterium]|nr:hypothetical protein [Pirellulales bacterium]
MTLVLVVLAMRHLNKPSTTRQLESVFSPQTLTTDPQPTGELTLSANGTIRADSESILQPNAEKAGSPAALPMEERVEGLSQVEDKTYFRPAEQEAWQNLFAQLQGKSNQQLSETSVGEMTYAQLLKQPDVYRGRVVTIRGTVLREELEQAGKNGLGVESYHRLWIRPHGGGPSLFVVYCLELPVAFPRGDQLSSAVSVSGYFFKNWSYSWDGGLALAPVILANSFSWRQPVSLSTAKPVSRKTLILAVGVTSLLGVALAWLALYPTRRRRTRSATPGDQRLVLPDDWEVPDALQQQFDQPPTEENRP